MIQAVITDVTHILGGPLQVTTAHRLLLHQAVLTWEGDIDPVFVLCLQQQARLQTALLVGGAFFELSAPAQQAAFLGALIRALQLQHAPKPWGRFPR